MTLSPGPTCHKMTDLSPGKMFLSSAFEPSEDELSEHARSKRATKRPRYSPWDDNLKRGGSPELSFEDRRLDSDSDDDMPPFPVFFAKKKENDARSHFPF
jgi:hypothetical protein